MKSEIRYILIWLLLAVTLICVIDLTIYTFTHPDMTKMRIAMNNWPAIAIALSALIISKLLIHFKNIS